MASGMTMVFSIYIPPYLGHRSATVGSAGKGACEWR